MKFLILVHVLSAIIGVGPTFFSHVLLRKNQTVEELRHSLRTAHRLEWFPKIGGSLAVLTGLLLIIVGNYGTFAQTWIIGSLVIYVIIQVFVIGIIAPRQKKLANWILNIENRNEQALPDEQQKLFLNVNKLYFGTTAFGVLLFIFMIVKPS